MEQVFIQIIYKLTEQILRREYQHDGMLKDLEQHLARAKTLKAEQYEAEILNTMGILFSLASDWQRTVEHYEAAYGIAKHIQHVDLQMKLLNNLSSYYIGVWEHEKSRELLETGIRLNDQHQLKTLITLYLRANYLSVLITLGDFDAAQTEFEIVWKLAEDFDIGKYSRTEYTQIIDHLHSTKAQLDIAGNKCENVLSRLALISGIFAPNQIEIGKLYHAILCQHDDQAAKDMEAQLIKAEGGSLSTATTLEIANFLMHTRQLTWATYFLDQFFAALPTNREVEAGLINYAQHLRQKLSE